MPIDIAKIVSQQQKRYKSDFKEISKIGKGGFSKVYRVENEFDGQEYAIKKIVMNVKDIKDNCQVLLDRFLREARFLARINHPKIIRYYNSWVEVLEKERSNQRLFEDRSNNFKQEIVYFYDDPQESPSLENLVDFQPPNQSSNNELEGKRHTIIGKCEEACLRKSIKRNKIPETQQPRLGDLVNYSDDLELNEQIPMEKHPSRKALNLKKSTSQECKKNNSQDKRNEGLLDQYESLILYIQTEICKQTLDDYLIQRNQKLLKLKKHNLVAYKAKEEEYMSEARKILSQIIDGLQHMHKNRLIHRDLKPGNIFMNSPDDVKIGDFGLVKKIMEKLVEIPNEQSTETHDDMNSSNFCTKLYASPEQINNSTELQNYDHRIDIHALGLIILQLFHPMNTQMEIVKTLQDASLRGIVPESLQRVISEQILKCLKKDANLRPSLEDLQIEICNLGSSGFSTTTTTTQQENSPIQFPLQSEFNGLINIQFEGSKSYKSKKYSLKSRKLYIYKSEELQKAQLVYNLDECNCSMDKFNLISITHPQILSCVIQFSNEDQANTFFRQLQFGNNFIMISNYQHIVEDE